MYVGDFHSYPRFFHFLAPQEAQTWADLIYVYTAQRYEDLLYRCPDYNGITANDGRLPNNNRVLHPVGSYGMNAKGSSNNGLSPVAHALNQSASLPEHLVVNPAAMVGFADTISFPFIYPKAIGYGDLHFAFGPTNNWPDSDPYSQVVKRVQKRRHRGKFNILFVDCHIEQGTRAQFYTDRPEVRQRWNYMNSSDPEAGNY
jgi:prepilin-type processing-associated H-X9-DG protein